MNKLAMFVCGLLLLLGCKQNPTESDPQKETGSISLHISAASFPFQAIAKSAVAKITAVDMKDMSATLTITDSSVKGEIPNIPAGKARKIDVTVYDSSSNPVYRGSAMIDIKADTTNKLILNINRIVGSVSIHGAVVEAPSGGWSLFDGFEEGALSPRWTPYPNSVGAITQERAHSGTHSFKVTAYDFKYTFDKPLSDGKISWWYWDNSGNPWSYFYILTDTTQSPLVDHNLHVVTNQPATYSLYHHSQGYKNTLSRTAGWRKFEATVGSGKISLAIDGQVGITIDEVKPVLAFQVAGAIMDDLSVLSNSN